jgi:hypothetical protein
LELEAGVMVEMVEVVEMLVNILQEVAQSHNIHKDA